MLLQDYLAYLTTAHLRDYASQGRRYTVGTLRRIYGDDFAARHWSDMRLDTLLTWEGVASLNDLFEKT